MRLYDPKQGKITINGKNIRDFDLQELHNYIGIVNQNPDLFNAPLTDNIGYGNTDFHQKDIEKASDIANCTKFINKFRGKFDTFAGSRCEIFGFFLLSFPQNEKKYVSFAQLVLLSLYIF